MIGVCTIYESLSSAWKGATTQVPPQCQTMIRNANILFLFLSIIQRVTSCEYPMVKSTVVRYRLWLHLWIRSHLRSLYTCQNIRLQTAWSKTGSILGLTKSFKKCDSGPNINGYFLRNEFESLFHSYPFNSILYAERKAYYNGYYFSSTHSNNQQYFANK